MSNVFVQNESANPVLLGDGTRLDPGLACEVDETAVGKGALKSGILKKLDELPSEPEAPAAPDQKIPLSLDEVAAKLFAEPGMIPEDGFTASGTPAVDALEDAFEQDFSADDRDQVWDKVKELQLGSLGS